MNYHCRSHYRIHIAIIFEQVHPLLGYIIHFINICYDTRYIMVRFGERSLPRWRRVSGLDCGSEDPGLITGLSSLTRVGPLMARRLKTSSDVPVPVLGSRHAKDP